MLLVTMIRRVYITRSSVSTSPVIIGSSRSEVGLASGMKILREGGSAIDAVESSMRACEDNTADHYVGTGGLPNARGEVELDASIMVGSSRAFGAVAAMKRYPNPISVARAVMERLPQHCLLVGEGAETFAADCGFEHAELLTDEARTIYLTSLEAPRRATADLERTTPENELYRTTALALMERFRPHDGPWGTINILALDGSGELVAGVSTSGFPWKYPGRVGDSALPGAGIYCDARFGGAACTGRGEMAMRAVGAKAVVDALARGASPEDACLEMLRDAKALPDLFASGLRTLCLLPDGRHGAAATSSDATYSVMELDDDEPRLVSAADSWRSSSRRTSRAPPASSSGTRFVRAARATSTSLTCSSTR
jgi:beta-aspartyl-peptidase (threonine type)